MKPSANTASSDNGTPPKYWSRATSGEGCDVLTYAIRDGSGYFVLLALGAMLLLGGAWAIYWLISEGELTVAGVIFLLLIPGGVMLSGVYCLNAALWRRCEYQLGLIAFEARRYSLFGDKRLEIPRHTIKAISQAYVPPGESSPKGAKGDWVTFVAYHNAERGKLDEYALDGMHSEEEARWLGQILPKWAKVPLKRGFGAEFEEADPEELPEP